jgi:SAM-dependent methyltransferase
VIGELYEQALAGHARPEIEHADGSMTPLRVDEWLRARPGDATLVERCSGPTLDVGSGPGRLTVALAERGIPVLGIDVTPYAVHIARAAGALTLLRDVFGRVPGTGRWMTVLLADGNIGIGGDPAALLRRAAELLTPRGQALVEVQPPGEGLRSERVRLRRTWARIRSATLPARAGSWSARPGRRTAAGSAACGRHLSVCLRTCPERGLSRRLMALSGP